MLMNLLKDLATKEGSRFRGWRLRLDKISNLKVENFRIKDIHFENEDKGNSKRKRKEEEDEGGEKKFEFKNYMHAHRMMRRMEEAKYFDLRLMAIKTMPKEGNVIENSKLILVK